MLCWCEIKVKVCGRYIFLLLSTHKPLPDCKTLWQPICTESLTTWDKLKKIKEKKQTSNCFKTADNGSAFTFASYHNCPFVGIHHILDLPIDMLCPKKVPILKTSAFQKFCSFRRGQTKSRVRSSCAPTFVLRCVTFFLRRFVVFLCTWKTFAVC